MLNEIFDYLYMPLARGHGQRRPTIQRSYIRLCAC